MHWNILKILRMALKERFIITYFLLFYVCQLSEVVSLL